MINIMHYLWIINVILFLILYSFNIQSSSLYFSSLYNQVVYILVVYIYSSIYTLQIIDITRNRKADKRIQQSLYTYYPALTIIRVKLLSIPIHNIVPPTNMTVRISKNIMTYHIRTIILPIIAKTLSVLTTP